MPTETGRFHSATGVASYSAEFPDTLAYTTSLTGWSVSTTMVCVTAVVKRGRYDYPKEVLEMQTARTLAISCTLVWLLVGNCCWGEVLFDNGMPDCGGFSPSDFDGDQSGDEFSLAEPVTISRIVWWGVYFVGNTPPSTDDFEIRLFATTEGTPHTAPFISWDGGDVHRSDSGDNIGDLDIYSYYFDVPNTPLDPGVYVLSVVNNTPSTSSDWHWATSDDLGGSDWMRPNDSTAWYGAGSDLAFQIEGTVVPEPSSLLLLGVGLFMLALPRIRRGRKG